MEALSGVQTDNVERVSSSQADYLMRNHRLITDLKQLKAERPSVVSFDHPEVHDEDYDNDEYAVRVNVRESGEEWVGETTEDALFQIWLGVLF